MDASAIVISQDNVVGGATVFTINNPLVFLINVTYTGQVSDYIDVEILDVDGNVLSENLIAPAYSDVSITERRYIFDADQLLRGYNEQLQEFTQSVDTVLLDPNSNIFTIKFSWSAIEEEITFSALNGATQIGYSPCKDDIYNNVYDTQFIGYEGYWCYTYFYNAIAGDLKIGAGAGGLATEIGIVRAKNGSLVLGIDYRNLYRDTVYVATSVMDVRPFCEGKDKLIKYMDRNGYFRFYAFNRYFQETVKTKELGRTSKLITNILTAQTDSLSIGKTMDKFIELTAEPTAADLILLEDLFCSPLIYMYIGSGNDELEDWLNIKVADGDFITRVKKGNNTKITLSFEYPKQYTVTRF